MLTQFLEFVAFSALALSIAFFGLGYQSDVFATFIYLPFFALFFIYASLVARDARDEHKGFLP